MPILPYEAWVSTLLAQEAHKVNHEEVAATLLWIRGKAWVVRGRKVAKNVVDSLVTCRKARVQRGLQIIGDLALERTRPARPFELTGVEVRRRVNSSRCCWRPVHQRVFVSLPKIYSVEIASKETVVRRTLWGLNLPYKSSTCFWTFWKKLI